MGTFRGFIAVDLSGLVDLTSVLSAVADVDGKLKAVEPGNLHLTLKFLGDMREGLVEDIRGVMEASVKDVPAFDMVLKGCGAFPDRRRPRVLWVGCEGAEALTGIASSIDRGVSALGFKREKRSFSAHLTVARVRFIKDLAGLGRFFDRFDGVEFGTVRVGSIRLKRSVLSPRGPTYSTVAEVRLGRTGP